VFFANMGSRGGRYGEKTSSHSHPATLVATRDLPWQFGSQCFTHVAKKSNQTRSYLMSTMMLKSSGSEARSVSCSKRN
jgi:hypothetical protein